MKTVNIIAGAGAVLLLIEALSYMDFIKIIFILCMLVSVFGYYKVLRRTK